MFFEQGDWRPATQKVKEGMFLGGYVSFALRGKFSQFFSTFADKDSAWGICSLNRESACIYIKVKVKTFVGHHEEEELKKNNTRRVLGVVKKLACVLADVCV